MTRNSEVVPKGLSADESPCPMTRDQRRGGGLAVDSGGRRSEEFRAFSWETVKEAVAHVKTAQKETIAEKSPGASRSRTVQSGRPEQPFVRKWSAYLRPCHNRVCRLVLLGTTSRLQPHRSLTVQDLSRAEAVRAHDD